MFAVLGSVTLALMAVGSPSQASSLFQPASVSVAVDGGQAYVATPTTVAFTVTNHATNGAPLAAFTLVVPKGIGTVQPVGVTGPGNWRETVVQCGPRATCSSLVLVYGTLPLSQSLARPGQSVMASIKFTTPSRPGPLVFPMIGIGGGIFTTSDKPTVNVVAGTAASFRVTAPASVTAGATAPITVQALNPSNVATPYIGGTVKIQLGSDDNRASITPTSFSGSSATFAGTPPSVLMTLPASSTGAYTFNATFYSAAQQSVTVTETKPLPDATGTAALTVVSAPATAIVFDSIKDVSSTPALPNPTIGQPFVSSFQVTDSFGNLASTASGDVVLSASGPGSLTAISATPASPTQDGTFTDSYSAAAPSVTLMVTLQTTNANATATRSTPIDASGTAATFTPGKYGSLGTANFSKPNSDGSSNCALSTDLPICGQTILPNGANGQVSLAAQACTGIDTGNGLCAGESGTAPLVLSVTGNFKDPTSGLPLYSYAHPASETFTCMSSLCRHRLNDDPAQIYNSSEESIEDYLDYPLFIHLSQTDGFVQVPACQVVPSSESGPLPSANGIPGDNTVGACVDVTSIVRNVTTGSPHYGDVSFTVLFVDDPKTHP
jgi:hypothetical protein